MCGIGSDFHKKTSKFEKIDKSKIIYVKKIMKI